MHVTSARPVVAFALCLCGALALRASAYGLPLDRDAAVYQVIGRGLRGGAVPYVDLIDHKQSLVYPVYALIDLIAPGSVAAPRVASALAGAMLPAGTFPEYAACLQDAGYAPLEAPPPVVALMR